MIAPFFNHFFIFIKGKDRTLIYQRFPDANVYLVLSIEYALLIVQGRSQNSGFVDYRLHLSLGLRNLIQADNRL